MKSWLVIIGTIDVVLVACLSAVATGDTSVGIWANQDNPGRADVGGSVEQPQTSPGSPPASGGDTSTPYTGDPPSYTTTETGQPSAPTGGEAVPYVDPRFRGAQGRAPYDPNPTACLYFPDMPGACPVETPAVRPPRGGRRGRPLPIDPRTVAESIAENMPLLPGEITANPATSGWTGVASWFWLDPAPRTVAAVAVLGPQRVVVTAQPYPVWRFGDGAVTGGNVGRPYRPGADAEGSVRHQYETRCMPGDAGRNPHVGETCTVAGYAVEAAVEWAISFVATGPIETSGTLPSRTTTTSSDYPVNEVRAFLTEAGS